MIYVFDATRTLYARIAVEGATLEEAQEKLGIPSLENDDYPWVNEESVRFRVAYETWEAAFDTDVVTEPRHQRDKFRTIVVSENPLSFYGPVEPM